MKRSKIKRVMELVCHMVCSVYPYIGKGNSYIIDQIATKQFDLLSEILNSDNIKVLSLEGERDGVKASKFQEMKYKNGNAEYLISLDPVDGTGACASGVSRGITALGIFEQRGGKRYKTVPDCLSCFCIASNQRDILKDTLSDIKNKTGELKNSIHDVAIISSLHRDESELFWREMGFELCCAKEGETNLFLPNLLIDNLFLAGDTSISLFLESDYFIGRIGASESILESQLWEKWKGVLVSSKTMKEYPGSMFAYIKDRLDAAISEDKRKIGMFFSDEEIMQLYNMGWSDSEIINFNMKENYAPDFDLILIGSITGTMDDQLSFCPKDFLKPAFFDGKNLYIQFWIKSCDYIGKIDCTYDYNKREIIWIKKNL